jgi:hypothetical protein
MRNGTNIYVLTLLFVFLLVPADLLYGAAGWLEQDKLTASDGAAENWFGYSVSIDGDYAIVGASMNSYTGIGIGSAYIFKRNGTRWSQQQKLTASDGNDGDLFGCSVSISGDYAIVGAYGDDDNGNNSGSAYIFKRDVTTSAWTEQQKLTAFDCFTEQLFGLSVSISGDYAIVGAYGDGENGYCSGSAYIFKRDGESWSQQQKLTASDGAARDFFGYSVSINGDYAIVGACGEVTGITTGSAYIFKRDGTSWAQQQKLTASDGAAGDNFGVSVSISGGYAIVGACLDDNNNGVNAGSAYIFKYNGTSWSQQCKLTASDGAAGDFFGISVSIDGDYAVIGAPGDDGWSGSAYIFRIPAAGGSSWVNEAKLTASDGAAGDHFGWSASIRNGYAIVGAFANDAKGSAYIFASFCEYKGTKWHDRDADCYGGEAGEDAMPGWRIYKDLNKNGQFDAGEPNALTDASGKYVLTARVGVRLAEEHKPCWEQTYPGGDGTYGVYPVFEQHTYDFGNARPAEIHPSRWSAREQDKLSASDGYAGDYFGDSVSISGDYAIVGALYEDEKGTNSGSAYIFRLNGSNCCHWDQIAKLTASDGAADDKFGTSVSIRGDYAIVGAYGDNDDTGSAYIFKRNATTGAWTQQDNLSASFGAAGDRFGDSVSISGNGDYVIVGADGDDDKGAESGSAYIFKRITTGGWSSQILTASDGGTWDYFGYSVSISGDYAIVGAYGDYGSHVGYYYGSAYIFKRNAATGAWTEQTKLTASDGAMDDRFGWSVSISGDYAVIGAPGDDDWSGSAYIFKRDGTTWKQQVKLTASDGAADDKFGRSVSISGDYAIVGALCDDDIGANSGSAYTFERDTITGAWTEQRKLTASDGAAEDNFGVSVSINGAYAIVGAYGDDDKGGNSGSAYTFGKYLCPTADLNGDCIDDFRDFTDIARRWRELP